MDDIVSVYDKHFNNITVDKKFLKELQIFRIKWSQKSDDYINFLSGNLTGVYPIRFSSIDEANLYKLFKVDMKSLKYDSDRLRDIVPSRNVTSNVTYLSLVYLMHKFSLLKDAKVREEGLSELHFIFSVKALGSMFYRFFPYNLDIPTAKATYENLSNRFIIKKVGSWQKVIDYRAEDVEAKGIYYDRIVNLNTIDATKVISGIHSGYKSMLVYIFRVIKEVIEKRGSISTSTIIENIEDGTAIKDNIDSPHLVTTYLQSIITYPNDFVNTDLVHIIIMITKNVTDESLITALQYISNNYDKKTNEQVELIINQTMEYLRHKDITNPTKDILLTLNAVRGYWSTGDTTLKKTKDFLKVVSYKATNKRTSWLLSSLTIGVIIYIYLRAIVKNKMV